MSALAIAAGASAAGSILGGIMGSSAAEEAAAARRRYFAQQKKENQNWFDRRYNEDATQRGDVQRLLQITEDNIRKRNKAIAGREAVMGGASEDTAKEKERNNQAMADVVSQINANNERRKDEIEQQYRNRKQALEDAEAGAEAQYLEQKGANISQATSGLLSSAGLFAAGLGLGDGAAKTTTATV